MSVKTYGSLFAGAGGIDLGLDAANLECLFQVEIDENCRQTLSYHWPSVPKFSDIKDVSGYDLPFVDLITFGSPCQDLSTAGKKLGLDGERSSLFFEAVRIIKEMREKSNGQYPKWSIWENVVGALSSNGGADFGRVLHEMAEAGACFSEWAILDAQYFGVPQRRRRIYMLSAFDAATASRCGEEILSVSKISSGHSKKSSQQKQGSTTETSNSPRSGGVEGITSSREENLAVDIVGSLQARDYKGVGNQYVAENKLVIEDSTRNSYTAKSFAKYIEGVGVVKTRGGDIGGGSETLVLEDNIFYGVRRLTPIECERLMSWPDNHTLYRADGKTNSDTSRYKMCGNGVVSSVVKWIVEQIKEI